MNTGINIKGSNNKSARKRYVAMQDNAKAMETLADSMGELAKALAEQAKAFQSPDVGYITISGCSIGDRTEEKTEDVNITRQVIDTEDDIRLK